jgi:hypothetical protein
MPFSLGPNFVSSAANWVPTIPAPNIFGLRATSGGFRHLLGTQALPRYGVRRRFACALAAIMLIAAAWGFQAGIPTVGYVLGWSLVAAAFVNVSTGFCVPSYIVRNFFGKVVCE